MAAGNVYDNRFDGIQASYGKDIKLTAGYGKATASTASHLMGYTGVKEDGKEIKDFSDQVVYADLSGKFGNFGLGVGYYSFDWDNDTMSTGVVGAEDIDIWQATASYDFGKDFKLSATYLMGDDQFGENYKDVDDDGYVVTAAYKGAKASQPGSWGLSATYYDQGMTTYVDHTMNGKADKMDGFKGYNVTANYTFAKNIVGQVEWYDLEEKEGDERESQTLWAQMLFTF